VWSATPEELERQVAFAARHFEVVTADRLPALAARGRGRYVAFTFDDGYRDSHEVALPILRAHGVPATFFLTTGYLDRPQLSWWDEIAWIVRSARRPSLRVPGLLARPLQLGDSAHATASALTALYKSLPGDRAAGFLDVVADAAGTGRAPHRLGHDTWMTWDMARSLRRAGMALGAHTVSHPVLARLGVRAQREEIAGSLGRIHAETGERPRTFSYPVGLRGSFDGRTRALLEAEGVTCAFSYYGGFRRFSDWDPHDVRRAFVAPAMSAASVRGIFTLPRVFAQAPRAASSR
jgi:peptidoglycan/xylan/chitin deacetylase (PgdA/CDA1 family)